MKRLILFLFFTGIPGLCSGSSIPGVSDPDLIFRAGFDEGVGNISYDTAQRGGNLTLTNHTFVTSPIRQGWALNANGSNTTADTPASTLYEFRASTFTFAAFIRPESFSAQRAFVATNPGTGNGCCFYTDTTTGKLRAVYFGVAEHAAANTSLSLNKTYFAALVVQGTNLKYYLAEVGKDTKVIMDGNLTVGLMANPGSTSGKVGYCAGRSTFLGAIDEAQIWKKALTEGELNTIYQNTVWPAMAGNQDE